jgi:molecular chaperone GrpE
MTGKQRVEAAVDETAADRRIDDGPDGVELNPTGGPDAAQSPAEAQSPSAEGEPAEGQLGDGQAGGYESHDEHRVEHDLDELAAKAERADEYLVLAQRTRADFENYRKRATREAALAQERGIARLAKELLPAIDNLDRAVQASASADPAGAESDSQLVSGIRLVQADLLAAFARAGIEPFSPVGEVFDPTRHEAVAQLRVEHSEPGTVVEVYQQGYRLGDTVLRPARVLVAA